ncbi:MAG: GGDEF domain-containing protein [Lachnospiraceae bacterium]|nr:GGDEF domain-containing protein [Lachnospiraceae bacterium]
MSKFDAAKFSKLTNIKNLNSSSLACKYYMVLAFILHLCYAVLFFVLKAYPIAIYCILSTIMYSVLMTHFKTKRARLFLIVTNFELMSLICICVYHMGWEYNFYSYIFTITLLAILSSMDYKKTTYNLKFAYVQFAVMIIMLGVLVYITDTSDPIYTYTGAHHTLLNNIGRIHNIVNVSTMFMLLVAYVNDTNSTATKLDAMNNELAFIATHDPLTNLINRRSMGDEFTKAEEKYKEKKAPFCIILADIDDFKKVNDIYGHDFGDIVLKRTSKIILDIVGDKGAVCRWGGEEILILVYGDLPSAIKLAEEIRSTIQATSFVFNNTYAKATLTLGVAKNKPELPINKIVTEADANLYKGKKSTKNCVVSN